MKNLFTIVAVVLALSFTTEAQAQSYIGLELGPSFPIGDLSSKDKATPSFNLGLNGAYIIGENLGVAFNYSSNSFAVDAEAVLDEQGPNVFSYEQDNYSYSSIGIGLAGHWSLGESGKFAIRSRMLVGAFVGTQGKIRVVFSDGSYMELEESRGTVLGVQFGISPEIKLSNHIGVALNLDLYKGNPKYEFESTIGYMDYNQMAAYFNLSLGVNYLF